MHIFIMFAYMDACVNEKQSVARLIFLFPVRLEADAFQLWINGNKESLEEQCGDVTEDAFYKQCASIFKKLAKEQKKVR